MNIFGKEVKQYHIAPDTAMQWIKNSVMIHNNGGFVTIENEGKKFHIFNEKDAGFPEGWMKVEEFSA